jgi:integrase
MRKVRIHDLRHTYASQLIAAGRGLHYIQEQLGHHSPSFTLTCTVTCCRATVAAKSIASTIRPQVSASQAQVQK